MARYPAETADQIKARILNNVAVNADLAGRVSTGGELDLAAAMGGAVPTVLRHPQLLRRLQVLRRPQVL